MSLVLNAAINLAFSHTNTANGVTVTTTPNLNLNISQADGTGLNQQDIIWPSFDRTLAASASEELDLSGALTNEQGLTVVFVKVKGLWVRNKNTTAGDTLVVGGSTNAFLLFDDATDKTTIGPGGLRLFHEPSLAGLAVTDGTGDKLKFEETGAANTCTFDVCIWGTLA